MSTCGRGTEGAPGCTDLPRGGSGASSHHRTTSVVAAKSVALQVTFKRAQLVEHRPPSALGHHAERPIARRVQEVLVDGRVSRGGGIEGAVLTVVTVRPSIVMVGRGAVLRLAR